MFGKWRMIEKRLSVLEIARGEYDSKLESLKQKVDTNADNIKLFKYPEIAEERKIKGLVDRLNSPLKFFLSRDDRAETYQQIAEYYQKQAEKYKEKAGLDK